MSDCLALPNQSERWGAELLTEDVEHVDLSQRPFLIRSSDTEVGRRGQALHEAAGTCPTQKGSPGRECCPPSIRRV